MIGNLRILDLFVWWEKWVAVEKPVNPLDGLRVECVVGNRHDNRMYASLYSTVVVVLVWSCRAAGCASASRQQARAAAAHQRATSGPRWLFWSSPPSLSWSWCVARRPCVLLPSSTKVLNKKNRPGGGGRAATSMAAY